MYHTHFNSIHSTQIYLKDNLSELQTHSLDVLITANEQTQGVGRSGSKWDSYSNSLAMSFTLKPNPIPTMTPIEIGVLSVMFFHKLYNKKLFIKWPNDLLTSEGLKCGGIIAQYINPQTVIVGLGVNLGSPHQELIPTHYKHGLGSVDGNLELTELGIKKVSSELYSFILSNRFQSASDLQELFNDHCFHVGKLVRIDDEDLKHEGYFQGIGLNGEAIIEIKGSNRSFFSSSLTMLT